MMLDACYLPAVLLVKVAAVKQSVRLPVPIRAHHVQQPVAARVGFK